MGKMLNGAKTANCKFSLLSDLLSPFNQCKFTFTPLSAHKVTEKAKPTPKQIYITIAIKEMRFS
ncbi:hypothetical protein A3Q34_05000 [Colwellia sp. PAMC 20917]|nr:hypothetical protein A3Q34_05000 [Colwellia sp. PAMC 20917]